MSKVKTLFEMPSLSGSASPAQLNNYSLPSLLRGWAYDGDRSRLSTFLPNTSASFILGPRPTTSMIAA
jgi:hypothetical protein